MTCSSFCDITFCCNVRPNKEIWQQVFCHSILSSIYCSSIKCFELPCSLLMHISNSKIKSLVSFVLQIFGCTCAYYGYSVSYFNNFSFTHSMPSLIYILEVLLCQDESCTRIFYKPHRLGLSCHLFSMSKELQLYVQLCYS